MADYIVGYTHRGGATVASIADAKRAIREEAIRFRESAGAAEAVVFVGADDGIYAYLDQRAADADDTGANAFAVISRDDA